MSGGRRNDEKDDKEDQGGGWGSTFFKIAGAAAATAAVVGCGGYLSSASEKWICGFAYKLDPAPTASDTDLPKSSNTERQAILRGLIWIKGKGKRKVLVLSDNEGVVDSVCGAKDDEVRRQIRELLGRTDWEVRLRQIPRAENRVADKLADIGRELPFSGLREIGSPPQNCVDLL
ncbi:uncharacterized protein LOC131650076 [Vicia villosa]|uniref:uncharacterized protein LOC131650076 n=1 Tax=Vicia villosa TaxID=3911 RepID=UPI00273BABE1|nr:uncharacterized protein LOC131650076 [Vicia villosa]